MINDEKAAHHLIGKTITAFKSETGGSGGMVTLELNDGSKVSFSAWDDGGSAVGELTLSDGTVVDFCDRSKE